MIVSNLKDTPLVKIENDLVKHASMQVLVSPKEGWEDHVMRVFTLEKDGYTPKHEHPWPHINYIIKGEGTVMVDNIVHQISAGSYAYVPGNTIHQFQNSGDEQLQFICIVPIEGHKF